MSETDDSLDEEFKEDLARNMIGAFTFESKLVSFNSTSIMI